MKMTYLSHGHYSVSDADAGRLARKVKRNLPKYGYELRVELPDGELAWLKRTPHSGPGAPKRGWVWAVMR